MTSKQHTLKIHPKPLDDLLSGAKTCEIRFNDRGFQVGDTVRLQEIDPATEQFTGRTDAVRIITHIQQGYGLPDHLCVLSYAQPAAGEPVAIANRGKGAFWVKWTDAAEGLYGPGIRLYAAPPAAAHGDDFQSRVKPWMLECFGEMIAGDREERNHRFLEEALELVQSTGCTASEAHQLVDYVYGRPVGEPAQEVGGVMVTLAALCLANSLDMHDAAEVELARIWTKVEAIRAKQAAKPKHSPLPIAAAHGDEAVRKDAERYRWLRELASGQDIRYPLTGSPREIDETIDAAMRAQGDGES